MKLTASDKRLNQGCRLLTALVVLFLCISALYFPAGASDITFYVEETIPLEMPCVDESKAGDTVADLWREAANADIALVPGCLIVGQFPGGIQTGDILSSILSEDIPLVTGSLTGQQLKQLLEVSVSKIILTEEDLIDRDASPFDGFLQISGFKFRYDASAPVGERVDELTLDSGLDLLENPDTTVRVVLPAALVDGAWGYPTLKGMADAGETTYSAARKVLAEQDSLSLPADSRILIRGCNEQSIFSEYIPLWVVVPAMLLLAIPRFWIRKQERQYEF